MQSGCVYERQPWAPHIDASGGSVWPTVTVGDSESGQTRPNPNRCGGAEHESLRVATAQWPTPQVGTGPNSHSQISGDFRNRMEELMENWPNTDYQKPIDGETSNEYWERMERHEKEHEITPEDLSRGHRWPTPRTSDMNGPGAHGDGGEDLRTMASLWATPQGMSDSKNNRGSAGYKTLVKDVEKWTTPCADDTSTRKKKYVQGGTALSLQVQQTQAHGRPSSKSTSTSRQRLNPAFVSWLMGLPWWWTRAEPISFGAVEMELWLFRQRSLLESLCGEQASIKPR